MSALDTRGPLWTVSLVQGQAPKQLQQAHTHARVLIHSCHCCWGASGPRQNLTNSEQCIERNIKFRHSKETEALDHFLDFQITMMWSCQESVRGTSLVVQRLRPCASTAGRHGGQSLAGELGSHMRHSPDPQEKDSMRELYEARLNTHQRVEGLQLSNLTT